jgi:uncharacterized protein YggE
MNRSGVFILLAASLISVGLVACKSSDTVVNAPGANTTGLNVSGTGRASGPPDVVVLQLGVQAEAPAVADARERAASSAQSVIDSIKKNGVEDKDIRTTQFNIQPQYDNSRPGVSTIRAYQVSNTLSVKVRKLENASKVIDDAASAGGNNTVIRSISFSIDDPTQLQAQARADAMKQAQARADQLAKLGGISIGKAISISEGTPPNPILAAPAAIVAAPRTGDTSTPIESGQLEVTVTVNVLYKIE